jgi:hypothetical protein
MRREWGRKEGVQVIGKKAKGKESTRKTKTLMGGYY